MIRINYVSGADCMRIKRELDAAAASRTLTAKQLSAAMRVYLDDGYIPKSVGFEWIRDNPQLFASCIPNVADFLINQFDTPNVGEFLLVSPEVLAVIPKADRERVVTQAYLLDGARNSLWVRYAIEAGVPLEALAEVILAKLHNTPPPDLTSTMHSFITHEFMERGSGTIERANSLLDLMDGLGDPGQTQSLAGQMQATPNATMRWLGQDIAILSSFPPDDIKRWRFADQYTLWSVLTDEQLIKAIRIVIAKAPNLLFTWVPVNQSLNVARKLRLRLMDEQVMELLMEAAAALKTMDLVTLEVLSTLPPTIQVEMAHSTNGGSPGLLVHLALMLGREHGEPLLEQYAARQFTGGYHSYAVAFFRSFWPMLADAEDQEMAELVKDRLLEWTKAQGYAYGQVVQGDYYDRQAGRRLPQLQVEIEDGGRTVKYVQDRHQRPYYEAVADDWVFINTNARFKLTPVVFRAEYIPAHRTGKYSQYA